MTAFAWRIQVGGQLNIYETKITISVVSTVYGASIADASKELI